MIWRSPDIDRQLAAKVFGVLSDELTELSAHEPLDSRQIKRGGLRGGEHATADEIIRLSFQVAHVARARVVEVFHEHVDGRADLGRLERHRCADGARDARPAQRLLGDETVTRPKAWRV